MCQRIVLFCTRRIKALLEYKLIIGRNGEQADFNELTTAENKINRERHFIDTEEITDLFKN